MTSDNAKNPSYVLSKRDEAVRSQMYQLIPALQKTLPKDRADELHIDLAGWALYGIKRVGWFRLTTAQTRTKVLLREAEMLESSQSELDDSQRAIVSAAEFVNELNDIEQDNFKKRRTLVLGASATGLLGFMRGSLIASSAGVASSIVNAPTIPAAVFAKMSSIGLNHEAIAFAKLVALNGGQVTETALMGHAVAGHFANVDTLAAHQATEQLNEMIRIQCSGDNPELAEKILRRPELRDTMIRARHNATKATRLPERVKQLSENPSREAVKQMEAEVTQEWQQNQFPRLRKSISDKMKKWKAEEMEKINMRPSTWLADENTPEARMMRLLKEHGTTPIAPVNPATIKMGGEILERLRLDIESPEIQKKGQKRICGPKEKN